MRIFTTVQLEYDAVIWNGINLEAVLSFLREYNMDDIAKQTYAKDGWLYIHTHAFPYSKGTCIMHGLYDKIETDPLFTCSTEHFYQNFTVTY